MNLPDIILKHIFEIIFINCNHFDTAVNFYVKAIRLVSKQWYHVFNRSRKECHLHILTEAYLKSSKFKDNSIDWRLNLVKQITKIPKDIENHDKIRNNILTCELKVSETFNEFKVLFDLVGDSSKDNNMKYEHFEKIRLFFKGEASLQNSLGFIISEQKSNCRFMNISTLNIYPERKGYGHEEYLLKDLHLLALLPSLKDLCISYTPFTIQDVVQLINNSKTLRSVYFDGIFEKQNKVDLKDILEALVNSKIYEFYLNEGTYNSVEFSIKDMVYLLNNNTSLRDIKFYGCKSYSDSYDNSVVRNSTINKIHPHFLVFDLLQRWEPDYFSGTIDLIRNGKEILTEEEIRSYLPKLSKANVIHLNMEYYYLLGEYKFTNLKSLFIPSLPKPSPLDLQPLKSLVTLKRLLCRGIDAQQLVDILNSNLPNLKKLSCAPRDWLAEHTPIIDSIANNKTLESICIESYGLVKSKKPLFFDHLLSILTRNKNLLSIIIPNPDNYPLNPIDHLEEFKDVIRKSISESRFFKKIYLNSNYVDHNKFLHENLINTKT